MSGLPSGIRVRPRARLEIRKRDLLRLLWMVVRETWRNRRNFSVSVDNGLASWPENGWIARKYNGTKTITIKIRGGARNTGLHTIIEEPV